jgi:hypothetical protein
MKRVLSWSVLGLLTSTMPSQAGSSPDVTGRAWPSSFAIPGSQDAPFQIVGLKRRNCESAQDQTRSWTAAPVSISLGQMSRRSDQ